MFEKNTREKIVKNVLNNMDRYDIKLSEFPLYLDKRIDYELNKIVKDKKYFENIIIYDDKTDVLTSNNFDIVLEDFIGKNPKLNTYSSTEDNTFSKYFNENLKYDNNIHNIFKKNKYSVIFSFYNLLAIFSIFSKKYLLTSILSILNNIVILIVRSLSLIIFSIVDSLLYFLLKTLKFLIKLKYRLHKHAFFCIFTIIIDLLLIFLKFIINFINDTSILFNKLFNNNFEYITDFINNFTENIVYSNKLLNDRVNRDYRSTEQKNLINKLKDESLAYLNECLSNSNQYLQDFDFYKMSNKPASPDILNNPSLKQYFTEYLNIEKQKIKSTIIVNRLKITDKKLKTKQNDLLNNEKNINKLSIKRINKNKELIRELDKKRGIGVAKNDN